jgi:betaine-aldehyde dehydrogenase
VVGRLRAPSLADVQEAIEKADHAFRTSGWAQKKPHERAAVLHRVAQLIRERAEPLAQLQRLDNGKPISETRALVASAAGTFQFFAAACETMEETITPSRGDFMTMSVYEPMGVVAAITPWNSPIASEAQKLAPRWPPAMPWSSSLPKPRRCWRWSWPGSAKKRACRRASSACCPAAAR